MYAKASLSCATVLSMNDSGDEIQHIQFFDDAVTASLGFLSSQPDSRTDGEWILLVEDINRMPLTLEYIALGINHPNAPIELAEQVLLESGYIFRRNVVSRFWAAHWTFGS